ncbi:MAG TPA: PQQ-dependent sugar dehydrogenase [Dehalococcoidia bacterium]|nr:PQQ-dependent sugar dehydrogenase [Dehalococcoidia bacterium]
MSLRRLTAFLSLAMLTFATLLATDFRAQAGVTPDVQFTEIFAQHGFVRPVDFDPVPGTSDYLVTEQGGFVYKVNESRPSLKKLVLDVSSFITTDGNEEGLLGLAFDPNYATTRKVFVYYTDDNPSREGVLARYKFAPRRVFTRAKELFNIPLPTSASNHNGGGLEFGPDGFLYLSVGEGGATRDAAQDINSRAGKVLRADVSGRNFTAPPTNPFFGEAGDDLIFAMGFRNPWRFSFDSLTGVLWLGDVGQNTREEVDQVTIGNNYGWPCREGLIAGPGGSFCNNPPAFTSPVFDYPTSNSPCGAVTGGRVYRGSAISGFQGNYVFADFCTGDIWFTPVASPSFNAGNLLDTLSNVSSFGVDHDNELIVVTFGGLFRMEPGS